VIETKNVVGGIHSGISSILKDNRSARIEIIRTPLKEPMPKLTDA
jgi:hypothetical protein